MIKGFQTYEQLEMLYDDLLKMRCKKCNAETVHIKVGFKESVYDCMKCRYSEKDLGDAQT